MLSESHSAKPNVHQLLKDHTYKQFHYISATEFFLQIEREMAADKMKEGSRTHGVERRTRRQKKAHVHLPAISMFLAVAGI